MGIEARRHVLVCSSANGFAFLCPLRSAGEVVLTGWTLSRTGRSAERALRSPSIVSALSWEVRPPTAVRMKIFEETFVKLVPRHISMNGLNENLIMRGTHCTQIAVSPCRLGVENIGVKVYEKGKKPPSFPGSPVIHVLQCRPTPRSGTRVKQSFSDRWRQSEATTDAQWLQQADKRELPPRTPPRVCTFAVAPLPESRKNKQKNDASRRKNIDRKHGENVFCLVPVHLSNDVRHETQSKMAQQ